MTYRSRPLLDLCRDKSCGCCGASDGTIVAAHRNRGKGMGIKVSDALVAPLCAGCHADFDQGRWGIAGDLMFCEIALMHLAELFEAGRVVVAGHSQREPKSTPIPKIIKHTGVMSR